MTDHQTSPGSPTTQIDPEISKTVANLEDMVSSSIWLMDLYLSKPPAATVAEAFEQFDAEIDAVLAKHGDVIRDLAHQIDHGPLQDLSDIVDDFVADAKDVLGTLAANTTCDAKASEAIEASAQWITDTISNGATERRIAAGCVVHGFEDAMSVIGPWQTAGGAA